MYNSKNQTKRIVETYFKIIILIISATLILSGITISKINTDYIENGIRAGKIVAERENTQISVISHNGIRFDSNKNSDFMIIDKVLQLLPFPINTSYLLIKEVINIIES